MEHTIEKPVVKKPEAKKPRVRLTHDDNDDAIIVIFMPDGRQVTFKMRNKDGRTKRT